MVTTRADVAARSGRSGGTVRRVRRWVALGLVPLVAGLVPRGAGARDGGRAGRQFGLSEPTAARDGPATGDRLVASGPASPVLLVQAGPTATDASPSGWQFTFAPYLWATRIGANLAVGPVQRH